MEKRRKQGNKEARVEGAWTMEGRKEHGTYMERRTRKEGKNMEGVGIMKKRTSKEEETGTWKEGMWMELGKKNQRKKENFIPSSFPLN